MKDIHDRHEDWLKETVVTTASGDIPVLIIDGNIDFEVEGARQREVIT